MAESIVRSEDEINRIIDWAHKGREIGSHHAGMSYEDGVLAMYDWLIGYDDVAPDSE